MQEPKIVNGVEYFLDHRNATTFGEPSWVWVAADGSELPLTQDEMHQKMAEEADTRQAVRDSIHNDGKGFTER